MIKKIMQFRYFGDSDSNSASNTHTSTHLMEKNCPTSLDRQGLTAGTAFDNYMPIIQLGVQALPGTKLYLNSNVDPIILGSSGMYELDLTNSSATLSSLHFDVDSIDVINGNPDGYLLIDILYQEA